MLKRHAVMFFVFALVFVSLLSGCGSTKSASVKSSTKNTTDTSQQKSTNNQSSNSKQQAPKILKIADTATVTTWDPSVSFSTEVAYLSNIYEPLVWANPPGSKTPFSPALAESWSHDSTGLIWKFEIRKNVTFHDGAKLTADAVKKSIERTINLKKGAAFIWAPIKKMEATGDYELTMVLKEQAPLLRIVSSGNGAWIMSPNVVDKDEAWFNQGKEAGTGPWVLQQYSAGKEIILSRNKNYWSKQKSNYQFVHISIVSEGIVQQQMLTSGQVDIATSIPIENISNVEKNPKIKVQRGESFYNFVGFFNTSRPPLDNKLVRQALSYAIPYKDIIEVASKGAGTQARGPVPQGLWPSDKSIPQYDYNIEKAKALLKEANVDPSKLHLVLTYAAENTKEKTFTPLIKEGFAKLGVDLQIKPVLWNEQWSNAKKDPKNAQDIFIMMYWPTYSDGYDNLVNLFGTQKKPSWNLSYWSDKNYDNLIKQAYTLSGTDTEKSKQLYLQAQNILVNQAPAAYLLDMPEILPMSASLTGNAINPNYPDVIFYNKVSSK